MIFIRPWFLLLSLMPLIFWIFKKKLAVDNPLERFIDKKLLPFLTIHFNIGSYRLKMRWFLFLWFLLTLAGAGPAVEKISVPAQSSAPSDVIIMDLSSTANNNSLTVSKLKLYDLLDALKGHQVGLVLYDEKGYTAVPITQDLNVIRHTIPALNPSVLPRPINQPAAGFKQADTLLKNTSVKQGHIIFITAGEFDGTNLLETAKKLPHSVTTLLTKNTQENHLAEKQNALSYANEQVLKKIGQYVQQTPNNTDIRQIVAHTPIQKPTFDLAPSEQADIWKDLGPYLLLCAIPFFLWWFRKGAFFILFLTLPLVAQAGLFERPDQEKYRKTMSGIEAYRNGNFEAARQVFEHGTTADDWYNAGNAKAHLNDIQGAIQAYDNALKLNPKHANAAWNKEYLEKQIPPQEQSQKNNQNQNKDNQNENQQSQNSSQENQSEDTSINQQENQKDQSEQSEQSEQSGNTTPENKQHLASSSSDQQEKQSEPTDSSSDEQEPLQKTPPVRSDTEDNTSQKENIETPIEASTKTPQSDMPVDQEAEQLLNRIKQDPSQLLKYRLYQQYMRQTQ